jgi:hypothetical protein
MANGKNDTDNISILAPKDFKNDLKLEAFMRDHTISVAGLEILKLGLPLYLKKFPAKRKIKKAA